MEYCSPSHWSTKGLSAAPKRSLCAAAAQVTTARNDHLQGVETRTPSDAVIHVDADQNLNDMISGMSEQEAMLASARTTSALWPSTGDARQPNVVSGNVMSACEGVGNKALAAALRRMQRGGLKRSAAACSESTSLSPPARARARRGEATDQHSIAERTRRTKITDRMRALHQLIPDASKTNKALMLDEVIQYVSMLQARLKVECMKKLDGRGADAAAPLCAPSMAMDKEGWRRSCNRMYMNRMIERVLDPLEDRLAEAERQVLSRLSHPSHDLSLAASYLATAGLILLPISHLSYSSSTTTSLHESPEF